MQLPKFVVCRSQRFSWQHECSNSSSSVAPLLCCFADMRRRKKDKAHDKNYSLSSTDDVLELSGRGRSSKSARNGDAEGSTGSALLPSSSKGGSPPQQRKRSLLGLGTMRDLVEQVQDTLTKGSKQEQPTALAVGGGSTHSSAEKSSRGHKAAALAAAAGGKSSSATPSDKSTPTSPAAAVAAEGGGARTTSVPETKKKVLDLKLLPSGSSLALRMKKQTQFTPSPSEFKPRERVDTADQPFCGVCAAPFTLMVRRQRCQVCGESVCAQCSSDKRHVEGQKGLQRVCDICIVEGPVVLDENGMYAVPPSPATTTTTTPTAFPRVAPSSSTGRSTAGTRAVPSMGSSPASSSATTTPSKATQGGRYIRTLFADAPSKKSAPFKSSVSREKGGGGGGRGRSTTGAKTTRPVHLTELPVSSSEGGGTGVGVYSAQDSNRGCVGGASGDGAGVREAAVAPVATVTAAAAAAGAKETAARAAEEAAEEAAAVAAAVAAAAALGADDDGDEGGPPSSAAPTKARKRSKKARRAGAACEARASADRRQRAAFGQTFSEYLGIGGGGDSNPASRSTKSTPRGNGSGGGFSNGTGVASSTAAVHSGGSGGGGATRRWESTGKKRSSGAGSAARKGPRDAVGHGSGFVRDFICGAGIHRLDPRRLAGPLTVCAAWTGLDKAWAGAWTLIRKLLECQYRSSGGGGGGGRSRRVGGRSGNGHCSSYHHHHTSSIAAGRRWRPGRRLSLVAALVLLASYRRYQVTHPGITTEHVLGAAASLFLALMGFLAHAVLDLARDSCGAVVPSLCGTREARLAGAAVGGGSAGDARVLVSGGLVEGDLAGNAEGRRGARSTGGGGSG